MREETQIGKILVDKGYISIAELELGLAHHRSTKKRLGETLIDMKLITRDQLNDALATKFEMPVIELTEEMLSEELWNSVPLAFIRENQIIPIFRDGRILHVVSADPTCTTFREPLEKLTGLSIEISIADAGIIRELIRRHSGSGRIAVREDGFCFPDFIQRLISVGAYQFTVSKGHTSRFIRFRVFDEWHAMDGVDAETVIDGMRLYYDLPNDYIGFAGSVISAENTLLPVRMAFVKNGETDLVTAKLGRQMPLETPFVHPQMDQLRQGVEQGVWTVLAGADPWISEIALSLLPDSPDRLIQWIGITIPGTVLPDPMVNITISGLDPYEWESAILHAISQNPDGLLIQCQNPIRRRDVDLFACFRNRPVKVILAINSPGPFMGSDFTLLKPVTLSMITRIRRLCGSCKRSANSHPFANKLPESLSQRLYEAVGCTNCHHGVSGSYSFVEVMDWRDGRLFTPGHGPYPQAGSSWESYPCFTTPALCLENIENIHPFDAEAVWAGWQIAARGEE